MAARGFIVAIENYDQSDVLARQLQGTNQDAASFRDWLINTKRVAPADILFCAGPNCAGRTTGTTRTEIIEALARLVEEGKDDTEELYVFFSGHGFSYTDSSWTSPVDVLVASDFKDLESSGGACFKLQEIQHGLWGALGPGHHYYFIDACRNAVQGNDTWVLGLGRKFRNSQLGKPTRYTLFSTPEGAVAKTQSGFAKLLVQGLSGSGRAKGWRGPQMCVTFELLCNYVDQKIRPHTIDSQRLGSGDGRIWELTPPYQSPCIIEIDNAEANDAFSVNIRNAKGQSISAVTFRGSSYTLDLAPEEYFCEVTPSLPVITVVQVAPPPTNPLDLYEPCKVRFEKQEAMTRGFGIPIAKGPVLPSPSSTMASVTLEGAPQITIQLENPQTGAVLSGEQRLTAEVPPGTYRMKVCERGVTIESRTLMVTPGQQVKIDVLERPQGEIQKHLLWLVTGTDTARMVNFSESLGPMANWDLALWLTLLGASRIIGAPGQFHKLATLPFEPFQSVTPGDSPVYVLAGLDKSKEPFRIGLSQGPEVTWDSPRNVKELTGIYEWLMKPERPGPYLLSVQLPKHVSVSYAVHCLPNRATFVTLVEDTTGALRVYQFLLPIYQLLQYLPPRTQEYLYANPLAGVWSLFLAQSQFARNRPIEGKLDEKGKDEWWSQYVYGQWLDPMMLVLAAYELIRRGAEKPEEKQAVQQKLRIVVDNLREAFPGIPDTEAIAKMVGLEWTLPQAPPLVLEGVLAFDEAQESNMFPLPADKLDYGSTWTAWRGAVKDD